MLKKIKDIITEEVKQSPIKISQLAQSVVSPGTSSVLEPSDDCTDAASLSASSYSPCKEGFTVVDLQYPVKPLTNISRQSSMSSLASDTSAFFPFHDASGSMLNMQGQVDLESASEKEDSVPKLNSVSKQDLYHAYMKLHNSYQKYKGRATDLRNYCRELDKENKKYKAVLLECQEKSLRRMSELKEQCSLEQHAKAHLEEALRNDLEEKDHLIKALQTKIKLLKESQNGQHTNIYEKEDDANDGLQSGIVDNDGDEIKHTNLMDIDSNVREVKQLLSCQLLSTESEDISKKIVTTNWNTKLKIIQEKLEGLRQEMTSNKCMPDVDVTVIQELKKQIQTLSAAFNLSMIDNSEIKVSSEEKIHGRQGLDKELQAVCAVTNSQNLLHSANEMDHMKASEKLSGKEDVSDESTRNVCEVNYLTEYNEKIMKEVTCQCDSLSVELTHVNDDLKREKEKNIDLERQLVLYKERLENSSEEEKNFISELQNANDKTVTLENELISCKDKLEECEKKNEKYLQQLKDKVLLVEREMENEKERSKNLECELTLCKKKLGEVDSIHNRLTEELECARNKFEKERHKYVNLKNMLESCKKKLEIVENKNKEFIDEMAHTKYTLESEINKNITLVSHINSYKEKVTEVEGKYEILTQELKGIKNELEQERGRALDLEKKLSLSTEKLEIIESQNTKFKDEVTHTKFKLESETSKNTSLECEVTSLKKKLEEMENKHEELENKVKSGRSNQESMHDRNIYLENELSLFKKKYEETENGYRALNQELTFTTLELEREQNKNKNLESELISCKGILKEIECKNTQLATDIQYYMGLEKEQDKCKSLESELILCRTTLDEMVQSRADIVGEVASIKNELRSEKDKNTLLQTELTSCQESLNKMTSEHEETLQEIKQTKEDLGNEKDKNTNLESELNLCKIKLDNLKDEYEKLEKEIKHNMEELANEQGKSMKIDNDLTFLKVKLEEVETENKHLLAEVNGTRSELNYEKDRNMNLENKLRSCEERLEKTEEIHKSKMEQISNEIKCANNDLENERKKSMIFKKEVTLYKKKLNETGAKLSELTEEIRSRECKLREEQDKNLNLESDLISTKEKFTVLESRHGKCAEDIECIKMDLKTEKDKSSNLECELALVTEKLSEVCKKHSEYTVKLTTVSNDLETEKEKRNYLEDEIVLYKEKLHTALSANKQMAIEHSSPKCNLENSKVVDELRALTSEINDVREKNMEIGETLCSALEQIDSIQTVSNLVKEDRRILKSNLEEANDSHTKLKSVLAFIKAYIDDKSGINSKLNEELVTCKCELEQLKNICEKANEELIKISSEVDNTKADNNSRKNDIVTFTRELEDFKQLHGKSVQELLACKTELMRVNSKYCETNMNISAIKENFEKTQNSYMEAADNLDSLLDDIKGIKVSSELQKHIEINNCLKKENTILKIFIDLFKRNLSVAHDLHAKALECLNCDGSENESDWDAKSCDILQEIKSLYATISDKYGNVYLQVEDENFKDHSEIATTDCKADISLMENILSIRKDLEDANYLYVKIVEDTINALCEIGHTKINKEHLNRELAFANTQLHRETCLRNKLEQELESVKKTVLENPVENMFSYHLGTNSMKFKEESHDLLSPEQLHKKHLTSSPLETEVQPLQECIRKDLENYLEILGCRCICDNCVTATANVQTSLKQLKENHFHQCLTKECTLMKKQRTFYDYEHSNDNNNPHEVTSRSINNENTVEDGASAWRSSLCSQGCQTDSHSEELNLHDSSMKTWMTNMCEEETEHTGIQKWDDNFQSITSQFQQQNVLYETLLQHHEHLLSKLEDKFKSCSLRNEDCSELLHQIVTLSHELYSKQYERFQVTKLDEVFNFQHRNSEPTEIDACNTSIEMQYLKNIIFQYMIGKETVLLAKVISAVMKFDEQQIEQVMQKELQKQTLLGQLRIL